MSEETEEVNEELQYEIVYTSDGEALNMAYTALCAVDGLDRYSDNGWEEKKEKIISKSLAVIEKIIDDLYGVIFPDEEENE